MENQETKKKYNKIVIIIVCFLGLCLLIGGVVLTLLPEDPPIEEKEEQHATEEEVNDINQILLYGIELFKSGEYKSFPKRGEKYYITLDELKQKGYDVSHIVKNCKGNNAIIYFEDKEFDPVSGYPIYVMYDCSTYSENNNPPPSPNQNTQE